MITVNGKALSDFCGALNLSKAHYTYKYFIIKDDKVIDVFDSCLDLVVKYRFPQSLMRKLRTNGNRIVENGLEIVRLKAENTFNDKITEKTPINNPPERYFVLKDSKLQSVHNSWIDIDSSVIPQGTLWYDFQKSNSKDIVKRCDYEVIRLKQPLLDIYLNRQTNRHYCSYFVIQNDIVVDFFVSFPEMALKYNIARTTFKRKMYKGNNRAIFGDYEILKINN